METSPLFYCLLLIGLLYLIIRRKEAGMNDWNSFVNSLNDDSTSIPTKASAEKRYPCGQCAGTGIYSGVRVHQEKRECFACRGKGYFKTDPRKLARARQLRAEKKQNAIETAQAHNQSSNIYSQVCDMASWNALAASLFEQHNAGRIWSEKQIQAVQLMIERMEIRRAERNQAAMQVDLSPIAKLFETAKSSGYKRPVFRAEGLSISLAPDTGNNAGALYVKTESGDYIGKVVNAQFYGTSASTDEHRAALNVIASNPREAAIRYGRQTGRCACCGRLLSNKQSIELGIGPICANKWSL
jgi:hypothetical protein